jgi:outer membrane protein
MKKLFIISALALIAFNANAQQGAFYVGASNVGFIGNNDLPSIGTGIAIVSYGDQGATVYGIAPEFGYYVSDRVAIGTAIGFSGYTIKNDGGEGFNFGFSPYVRYFLHQGENFGFYLQGEFDFLRQENEVGANKNTLTSWGIGVVPGVSYALSSHFSVLASFGLLGYASQKEKGANDALNTFGLNLDASTLNFSLRYTF